ncbi:MAG TPA: bacillithiol biosynthesis cysteine-adding enzyme BshC [Gemmatimonadales bacterium]|nr:bacillithiol biosynthesis cysteine-adding enzyme BshC [Gemmatimonadales bacterium]
MTLRFDAATPGRLDVAALDAARAAQQGRRFPRAAAGALVVAGRASEANRDALLAGTALAVTTGQQPGLFTGPLYTVYKALTAAALAEQLGRRWGRPVVPVFWVAGDDHDFAEVNHCAVVSADGSVRTVTLRERAAGAVMLPAFREPVGAEGAEALAALEAALPPSEFRSETVAWLGAAYTAERSVAEAHAVALASLLEPFGVVVCRGWNGALKRGASEVFVEALRSARTLDEALGSEAAKLKESGAAVPVPVGDGMALVMVEGTMGRDRLRIADGAFVTRRSGESFTLEDLEEVLRSAPERLSANVLLRPAVEAHLFPTVAYVGGPAELAYLRQDAPVFAHLAVPRPVPVPRLSGFLVDAKTDKTLERLGLRPADLAQDESALATTLAKESLPQDAAGALAALRAALQERYAAVLEAAVGVEKTLERPIETARNQALHAADEVEKRLVAALKRRNETALQQIARARTTLFPGGEPQERVLTAASYLARYGRELLPALAAAAREHAGRLLEASPAGA